MQGASQLPRPNAEALGEKVTRRFEVALAHIALAGFVLAF
jgi:hypothetical protein